MTQQIHWYNNRDNGSKPSFKRRFQRCIQILIRPADGWLIARILFWAFVLPVLKRVVPLKKLALLMWSSPKPNQDEQQKVVTVVRWIYYFLFPADRTCIQRSLILYRFLSKNNFDPQLVTGLRRTNDGGWKGHAWVVVDGRPFEESSDSVQDFRELMVFGRSGVMKQSNSIERAQ